MAYAVPAPRPASGLRWYRRLMASTGEAAISASGARGKVVPPPLVQPLLSRPHLYGPLEAALARRLVTVIADAGFGKSTLLASWSGGHASAWYTATDADREVSSLAAGLVDAIGLRVPAVPPAVRGLVASGRGPDAEADEPVRAGAHAALIAEALEQHLARDLVLVIDELSEIGPTDPAARLLEVLTHMAPPKLHIVLASRTPPPFPVERLRGQGQVLSIDATALAFRPEETVRLLTDLLGDDAAELAAAVHEITGGWPAAVRLAAEALRFAPSDERGALLGPLLQPGGAVYGYLAEEAISRSEPEVRALLELVAPLKRFSAELCDALGLTGSGAVIGALAARGLFLQPTGEGAFHQLTPLLREFTAATRDADSPRERATLRRAATWHLRHGHRRDALDCLIGAGVRADAGRARLAHRAHPAPSRRARCRARDVRPRLC